MMEFITFIIKYRLTESVIIAFCLLAMASVFFGIGISQNDQMSEDEDEERDR